MWENYTHQVVDAHPFHRGDIIEVKLNSTLLSPMYTLICTAVTTAFIASPLGKYCDLYKE